MRILQELVIQVMCHPRARPAGLSGLRVLIEGSIGIGVKHLHVHFHKHLASFLASQYTAHTSLDGHYRRAAIDGQCAFLTLAGTLVEVVEPFLLAWREIENQQ